MLEFVRSNCSRPSHLSRRHIHDGIPTLALQTRRNFRSFGGIATQSFGNVFGYSGDRHALRPLIVAASTALDDFLEEI